MAWFYLFLESTEKGMFTLTLCIFALLSAFYFQKKKVKFLLAENNSQVPWWIKVSVLKVNDFDHWSASETKPDQEKSPLSKGIIYSGHRLELLSSNVWLCSSKTCLLSELSWGARHFTEPDTLYLKVKSPFTLLWAQFRQGIIKLAKMLQAILSSGDLEQSRNGK